MHSGRYFAFAESGFGPESLEGFGERDGVEETPEKEKGVENDPEDPEEDQTPDWEPLDDEYSGL